jgi:Nucleotide modification associated domain 1
MADDLKTSDLKKEIEQVEFESDLAVIFESAMDLLISKHKDYGPKNISQSPGGPLNGLRVRMWDKMARINNLYDNGVTPQHESLRDSFIDLMNYSAIALMVLDGNWDKEFKPLG